MTDLNELVRTAVAEEVRNLGQKQEDTIFDPKEALAFFGPGLTYSSLMRQAREGKIPCFHIGSRVFFRRSRLIEWIEQQEQGVR